MRHDQVGPSRHSAGTTACSPERTLARLVRDDVHVGRDDHPVTCLRCAHPLALVPDVGWVVDQPAGSYDLCEAHAFGVHDPSDG